MSGPFVSDRSMTMDEERELNAALLRAFVRRAGGRTCIKFEEFPNGPYHIVWTKHSEGIDFELIEGAKQ